VEFIWKVVGPESGVGFKRPKRRPKAKGIIPTSQFDTAGLSRVVGSAVWEEAGAGQNEWVRPRSYLSPSREVRPAALKTMPSSATQRTTFEFLLVIAGIASGDWWFYQLALDGE
jgi:hypothetical protein